MKISRLYRAFDRIKSRNKDYSGLRAASSVSEAIEWFKGHGTRMLNGNVLRAKVVQMLVREGYCKVFIESGTSHAATAIGISRFLDIPVWSCENSRTDYLISKAVTAGMQGIELYCLDSREFLNLVVPRVMREGKVPMFYLDAHEGAIDSSSLPLAREVEIISALDEFVVVVDDFRIPGDDSFVFGTYGDVSIDLNLVRNTLQGSGIRKCYFPAYEGSDETGFATGFCVFWRSPTLDDAVARGSFPLNLLRSHKLQS